MVWIIVVAVAVWLAYYSGSAVFCLSKQHRPIGSVSAALKVPLCPELHDFLQFWIDPALNYYYCLCVP
jgi:hypothetical protein